MPDNENEKGKELSLEEIKRIAEEARGMGCQHWDIAGGEPMLREDFEEIFEVLTRNVSTYLLNTNGTLITPRIAKLIQRKRGRNLVAVYGADASVHDHITRTPGAFAAVMRGLAYLKEAGADFEIQFVPMSDNFHQRAKMIELADALGARHRFA